MQPKRRSSLREEEHSQITINSTHSPACVKRRHSLHSGHNANWQVPQEPVEDEFSLPVGALDNAEHSPSSSMRGDSINSRFNMLESTLERMSEFNSRLLAQHSTLMEKLESLEEKVAMKDRETAMLGQKSKVITSITPSSAQLSEKIVSSIKEFKYVDFRLLLDNDEVEDQSHVLALDGEGNSLVLQHKEKKIKKKTISWTDWGVAWSKYIGILTSESGDSMLTSKLGKHYEVVYGLMKNGHKWREYDEGFRKKVESEDDVVFGSIHFELYFAAQMQALSKGVSNRGFCFAFNSFKGCRYSSCRFYHGCFKCQKSHSIIQCPLNQSTNRHDNTVPVRFSSPQSFTTRQNASSAGYQFSGPSFRSQRPFRPRASQYSLNQRPRQ